MLTLTTMTISQQNRIHVPATGLDKRGRPAPLEGTPVVTLDTGAEFITIVPDEADPTGLTLLVRGVAPGLYAGHVERDAKIGTEIVLISAAFAGEITTDDATSFDLTADQPEDQPA